MGEEDIMRFMGNNTSVRWPTAIGAAFFYGQFCGGSLRLAVLHLPNRQNLESLQG